MMPEWAWHAYQRGKGEAISDYRFQISDWNFPLASHGFGLKSAIYNLQSEIAFSFCLRFGASVVESHDGMT